MKVAIIDPVGIKAGMNCYDIGLLNALSTKGIQPFTFSNFTDKNFMNIVQFNYFFQHKRNVPVTILNYINSHFKALVKCKKEGIQWIILHVFSATSKDYFSFLLAKLFKIKIIAIIHDVNSLSGEDKSFFRKQIYALANVLVVHNETSKESIQRDLNKKDKTKLIIIPHGNYIEFISPNTIDAKFDNNLVFDRNHKYLLFFGQIKKAKGLDILLKAVPFLSEKYKIIIAGRPHKEDFTYYESIIQELGIQNRVIKIIRFITDEERDFLFKKCDALILPYRKIFQSGVLLMAMSYGLPVIASDLTANKEVIEDGRNGILFEDGNYMELALKIEKLFFQNLIDKIRANTFSTAKDQYSWAGISEKYTSILKNDLSSRLLNIEPLR